MGGCWGSLFTAQEDPLHSSKSKTILPWPKLQPNCGWLALILHLQSFKQFYSCWKQMENSSVPKNSLSISFIFSFKMAFHLFITSPKLQHSLNYFARCQESMVRSSRPCCRLLAPPPSHKASAQSWRLRSAQSDLLLLLKGRVYFASNHSHCHPHMSPEKRQLYWQYSFMAFSYLAFLSTCTYLTLCEHSTSLCIHLFTLGTICHLNPQELEHSGGPSSSLCGCSPSRHVNLFASFWR